MTYEYVHNKFHFKGISRLIWLIRLAISGDFIAMIMMHYEWL